MAALDGWVESIDLGSTVFRDGSSTISVRVAPRPAGEDVVAATGKVLRALPGAKVEGPTRLEVSGFEAAFAFDLTFTPERAERRRYQRRHVVLLGRTSVFHLFHTAPAGSLSDTAASFEQSVKTFREEG